MIGESASGWQQQLFASPVQAAANTDYVVSYHTSQSNYVATNGGFAATIANAPLSAGVGAGVYVYTSGTSPQFPAQVFQNSNYWVDVIFEW